MQNKKIFLIIGIIILIIAIPVGIILLERKTSFKLGAQNPINPENVAVYEITSNSAVISWITKKEVQAAINYGINPNSLSLIKTETSPSTQHQITLTNLLPGTTYYFTIKIGENIYDNNGTPFSFTTNSQEEKPTPTLTPPNIPSPAITEEKIEEAIKNNDTSYDLNKDGAVNSLDLLYFRQNINK